MLASLALGFMTVVFALDEHVGGDKVVFAGDAWRVAFGVAGAFITYRSARAMVRTINGASIGLDAAHFRRARLNGAVIELIGIWFLVAAWSRDIGERSVAFTSWTKPVYIAGGILFILTGLAQWVRPKVPPEQGFGA